MGTEKEALDLVIKTSSKTVVSSLKFEVRSQIVEDLIESEKRENRSTEDRKLFQGV